jgi:hypothetical protein
MISKLNHSWRRRSVAVAALAITAGLTFLVGAARPDAGNPILGTITASIVGTTDTTVTISVKGEWNWLTHNGDCNYDRAATGAGILWGDRNGADNTRTITSITRSSNVVTVTTAAQAWKVGDQVSISGVANASFNGGPFTVTSASSTTIKYSQTGANATSSGGTVKDLSVFNGWLVYKSSTSNGYIGTKVGNALNPIDREVHPTDIGNVPADGFGPLPGANLSNGAPANQVIFDPGPDATTGLGDYTQWKGGCGREPVDVAPVPITSATENASKVVTLTLGGSGNASINVGDSITVAGVTNTGYNGNYIVTSKLGTTQITYTSGKTGLTPSSGGTVLDNTLGPNQSGNGCIEWCGDPWGSWGYQTINGYPTAFQHTYLKTLPDGSSGLPDKICVNFYDVHGGGTNVSSFQAVNGAKEIQVDGNGDNSISTNAFNVTQGANCTSLQLANPTVTTDAGPDFVIGSGNLIDSATLTGGSNPTGTITFKLYGPDDANCSGPVIFTSTTAVSGNGSYQSDPFTPTQAGTYRWIANYSGDTGNNPTANGCNGANEDVVVLKHDSAIVTHQSLIPQDNATVTGAGVVVPTGQVTFKLFKNDNTCSSAAVFTQAKPLDATGKAKTTNSGDPATNGYTANGNGTWYWRVSYAGDGSNQPSESNCVETFTIKDS